jgi:hypothetical protein
MDVDYLEIVSFSSSHIMGIQWMFFQPTIVNYVYSDVN